jgi:large subunit ribosomal protein L16
MRNSQLKQKKRSKHVLIKTPSRFKYKRLHKGRINGFEFNQINTSLCYGAFGLKILKPLKLIQKHVTAFKTVIDRKKLLKKKQQILWVRGLLNISVTKKPNEIRMGKGKGPFDHWIMRIKPGKIFVELSPMSNYHAKRIFKIILNILGVPGQIVQLKRKNNSLRFLKN